eukprot:3053946-Pleurochrysis_carterae.AAC.2
MQAEVDPIQAFAKPVMEHMNADHSDATTLMVQVSAGKVAVTVTPRPLTRPPAYALPDDQPCPRPPPDVALR